MGEGARAVIMPAAMALSVFGGMKSPLVALAFGLYPLWLPFFVPHAGPFILFGSILFVSFTYLVVGLAAAGLYERLVPAARMPESNASRLVCLTVVVVLSLPSFLL